jgi:hypothetical protein
MQKTSINSSSDIEKELEATKEVSRILDYEDNKNS